MNITILGTGNVARIIAPRLLESGHSVILETRNPDETRSRDIGNELYRDWLEKNPKIELQAFGNSCAQADIIINATNGKATMEALKLVGSKALADKILLDLTNPLDFSNGMPPTLFVSNTDSLAERIQHAYPNVHVVKSLNTLTANLMLNPNALPGDHVVFVCGNSDTAKSRVKELLTSAGWQTANILDLGDITGARGMEQSLPLWLRIWGSIGTVNFNFNIVR